jgi:hypothetical protein
MKLQFRFALTGVFSVLYFFADGAQAGEAKARHSLGGGVAT